MSVASSSFTFLLREPCFILCISAEPTFIERLPLTSGALSDAADATKLSCRAECYPLCQIDWFRNGIPIRESPMYTVVDSFVPENIKVKRKKKERNDICILYMYPLYNVRHERYNK